VYIHMVLKANSSNVQHHRYRIYVLSSNPGNMLGIFFTSNPEELCWPHSLPPNEYCGLLSQGQNGQCEEDNHFHLQPKSRMMFYIHTSYKLSQHGTYALSSSIKDKLLLYSNSGIHRAVLSVWSVSDFPWLAHHFHKAKIINTNK